MSDKVLNLFWDSCVFCRYLTQSPTDFVSDIEDFLRDAGKGKYLIHYSTLAMAEVKPSHLKHRLHRSFQDLMDAFEGCLYPIEPTPQIMMDVALMRDVKPHNPDKPASAVIGIGDAIQLATCVFAGKVMGVEDLTFHTLDCKSGSKEGEKTVPIIGLENWFVPETRNRPIQEACALRRAFPTHPQQRLPMPLDPPVTKIKPDAIIPPPSPQSNGTASH